MYTHLYFPAALNNMNIEQQPITGTTSQFTFEDL